MTGDAAITFGQVGIIASVLVPGIGVVLWVVSRFNAQRESTERALAIRDAKIDALEESLQSHKLYAAETFATRTGLKESLEHVHKSLDRLADRIDELLKEPKGQAALRRSRRSPGAEG